MLQFINFLCKNKNLCSKHDFEKPNFGSLNQLFDYRHPKTGDYFVHYLARSGNLQLIKLIHLNYETTYPKNYFDFENHDGKTMLHEVKILIFYLFTVKSFTIFF